MAGYKDFQNGNTLDESELDGYLMRQTVMRFATEAARDSALTGVLEDGMVTYTDDNDVLWIRDGGAWDYLDSGAITYTPAWTAVTSNPAIGNGTITGRYWRRRDKLVTVEIIITTGTTTTYGSGAYLFSLPVNAAVVNAPAGEVMYNVGGVRPHTAYVQAAGLLASINEAGANGAQGTPLTFPASTAGNAIRIFAYYRAA